MKISTVKPDIFLLSAVAALTFFSGCASTQSMRELAEGLPKQTKKYEALQLSTLDALETSYKINIELIRSQKTLGDAYRQSLNQLKKEAAKNVKIELMARYDASVRDFILNDLKQKIKSDFEPKIEASVDSISKEIKRLTLEAEQHPDDKAVKSQLRDKELQEQYLQTLALDKIIHLDDLAWSKSNELRKKLKKEVDELIDQKLSNVNFSTFGPDSDDAKTRLTKLSLKEDEIGKKKIEVTKGYARLYLAQKEVALEIERGVWGRASDALTEAAKGGLGELKDIGSNLIKELPLPGNLQSLIDDKFGDLIASGEQLVESSLKKLKSDTDRAVDKGISEAIESVTGTLNELSNK